jgi:hypothetical protein
MKVLYDHQIFQVQQFGGISRYFFALLSEYQANGEVEWELPIRYSPNAYLRHMSHFNGKLEDLPPSLPPKNYYRDFMGGWHFKGKWQLYSLSRNFFPIRRRLPNQGTLTGSRALRGLKKGASTSFILPTMTAIF